MPFKYFLDQPQLVSVGGMFHGVMFVLYILTAVHAFVIRRWNLKRALLIIGCIFIPFLFIKQDRMIQNEELELKKGQPINPKKRA
jgi:integral membrane protein